MKERLRELELERAKIEGQIELIQEMLEQTKTTTTSSNPNHTQHVLNTNLVAIRGPRLQKQMAKLIGITPAQYGYIERKQLDAVQDDHIRKVSEWLQQH